MSSPARFFCSMRCHPRGTATQRERRKSSSYTVVRHCASAALQRVGLASSLRLNERLSKLPEPTETRRTPRFRASTRVRRELVGHEVGGDEINCLRGSEYQQEVHRVQALAAVVRCSHRPIYLLVGL